MLWMILYMIFIQPLQLQGGVEKKFMTQVSCFKKAVVGKFLNFKKNDANPIVKQVEELKNEMKVEGMDNRMNEKADANSVELNEDMVGESSSKSKKPGHKAKDCCHKKEHGGGNSGRNSNQANHMESPKEFAGLIEYFLPTNVVDWWVDTGATKHICNSRRMFVSYQKVNEPEPMFMGNKITSKIKGKGKVILKLTSGNDLVFSNVKEYQENDKIGSKPDKNEKRGEARKSQKQLQSIKKEKLKKMQKEGPKMQSLTKLCKL
nr:BTB/POZ domain-containing protein NPY2-like [Tanacetum cinerariifolium]